MAHGAQKMLIASLLTLIHILCEGAGFVWGIIELCVEDNQLTVSQCLVVHVTGILDAHGTHGV